MRHGIGAKTVDAIVTTDRGGIESARIVVLHGIATTTSQIGIRSAETTDTETEGEMADIPTGTKTRDTEIVIRTEHTHGVRDLGRLTAGVANATMTTIGDDIARESARPKMTGEESAYGQTDYERCSSLLHLLALSQSVSYMYVDYLRSLMYN